jgi:adenylate cyclase
VNLAERLESANKFYGTSILICNNTRERVKDHTPLREIDLMRVRGMTTPLSIYEAIGHHTEDSLPHMDCLLAAFAEGLACYRRREWVRAADHFREALAACPEDGPSRLYQERCAIYQRTPPSAEWDGVWTMQTK